MEFARCARPACPGEPQAWFAYDYEARCAWLDDSPSPSPEAAHQWPLCARHADNLRVPRGWFCVDRRAEHLARGGSAGVAVGAEGAGTAKAGGGKAGGGKAGAGAASTATSPGARESEKSAPGPGPEAGAVPGVGAGSTPGQLSAIL